MHASCTFGYVRGSFSPTTNICVLSTVCPEYVWQRFSADPLSSAFRTQTWLQLIYNRLMRLSIINPLWWDWGMALEGRSEDKSNPWCRLNTCSLLWVLFIIFQIFLLSPSEESIPPRLLKVHRGAANNSLNRRAKKNRLRKCFYSCSQAVLLGLFLSHWINSKQPRSFIKRTVDSKSTKPSPRNLSPQKPYQ